MDIKIATLIPGEHTALVGKRNGKIFKEKLVAAYGELPALEEKNEVLNFIFPPSVITINSSFFLAVFAQRVRVLGEDLFNRKYNFSASQHIQDKIRSHVAKALNASTMDDILNV